jgi:mannose-6-phosphate isomerase-like protein (cupin superfamily)
VPERPIIIPPGEGHRLRAMEFLARSEDTPRFTFAILTAKPGMEVERHVHEAEDDSFYILDGELTFLLADGEEVTAGAGTYVLVPPGVEHGFRNASGAEARAINVHAPAGFDVRMGIND